ncbi:hypothetical protein FC65_GL001404 [Ligilactobacillus acidipiscis DSM 15836]|uniref:DUF3847 domain-containing protein n=1 Tax=Ligilactobacillus acidipiscis DSM 15836 TaxID=1423716 RepID=A0ABR5PHW1_9LACO|nr:hypothetical protein [Ligilactobacillus acidipiscis]KRM18724.1 hypothetical protein FC65_GL001404 [Ligilactobacillus acidipiscis DSM 15836]GAW65024.1 hypothetical protein Lacidipiscis_02252 [Ligilactobacillus acidipiscis]GEN22037.1 hypothetical protein LAC02_53180 [Ligilactobacillus acidipiscis]
MNEQYNKLVSQRDKAQKKIEQADFKARQSKYYENQKKRKARSRRLIQKGALFEKYFHAENLSIDESEELLKIFANYVNANKPSKYKKDSPND